MSLIKYDIGVRVQALTLYDYGAKPSEILDQTGISESSLKHWKRVSRERGFNLVASSYIIAQYVADAPRSGRPTIIRDEAQRKIIKVLEKKDTTCQYSIAELIAKSRVKASTSIV